MKNTIKTKIFLLFVGFMVAFILCGVLINTLFLEQFYIFRNEDIFTQINSEVTDNLNLSKDEFISFIESIDRAEGISITVTDNNMGIKYNSYSKKKDTESIKLPKETEDTINQNIEKLNSSYIYTVTEKASDQTPKLVYIKKQSNGDLLILSKPIKSIRESADISNQFYIFSGMLIIIVGSFVMFSFSRKITKPIAKMSKIADDISNLNFDNKVEITSKDEIGELSASINTISEKLKASIDGLKDDIEHQKELARNTSHELKTPIGVIKGYTEGLLYGVAESKEMKEEYYHIIINECDRMDNMVKELLDLSSLEAKNATLGNVTTFLVSSLIKSVLERFDLIFKEQNITCQLECINSMQISGDYELIERAIGNIVMNAVKYNDDNKYIKITAKEEQDKKIISVFNTGAVIPEKEINNIFEVFYKVDKSRSRKMGGHGLGLSIVRSIIKLHGGDVLAQNKKGGVEFLIILK